VAARRRWSWAAVLAIGLLVIAVLAPVLRQRGDSAQARPDPAPAPSATPTVQQAAPPPAGYRLYRDPNGWSIAVPAAWRGTRTGTAVTFRDGDRVLTVTRHADPPADPYAARLQQQALGAKTPGYDFMRVARVPYRSWPTADWEYRAGTRPIMHTVVRSTVPTPDQVLDISWTTEDRRWTADHAVFDTATGTFAPGA
jgi:hypothetical protein